MLANLDTMRHRIRRAFGSGCAWAAAWFGAGLVLARVPGYFSDLPFALVFAPLGFATSLIFSGLSAWVHGPDQSEHRSFVTTLALGAASGLALAGLVLLGAAFRAEPVWPEFMLFGPPLASGGAVTAAGSLALARRRAARHLR